MRTTMIALALGMASPALAQSQSQSQAADPDPARLTAARALIEVVMPAAMRDQMIEQTTSAMLTNVTQGMVGSPQMKAAFAQEPRAEAVFKRYIARQQAATRSIMQANMPDMLVAMTRAYARRFTVAQLGEARAFFATPTGQAYVLQAPQVMADPDVGAWMQTMVTASMARVPAETAALQAELKALQPAAATPETRR